MDFSRIPLLSAGDDDHQLVPVDENGAPMRSRRGMSIFSLVPPQLGGISTRSREPVSPRPRKISVSSGRVLQKRASPKHRSFKGPGKVFDPFLSNVGKIKKRLVMKRSMSSPPAPASPCFGTSSTEDMLANVYDRCDPDVLEDVSISSAYYGLGSAFELRHTNAVLPRHGHTRTASDDSDFYYYPNIMTSGDKLHLPPSPEYSPASNDDEEASHRSTGPLIPITNSLDSVSLRRRKSDMKLMRLLGPEAANAVCARK